jgi:hypothetical protein
VAGCPHAEDDVKRLNSRGNRRNQLTGRQSGVVLGILGVIFVALCIGDYVWIYCRECAKLRKAERDQPSTHDQWLPNRRWHAAEGASDIELSGYPVLDHDSETTCAPIVPQSAHFNPYPKADVDPIERGGRPVSLYSPLD